MVLGPHYGYFEGSRKVQLGMRAVSVLPRLTLQSHTAFCLGLYWSHCCFAFALHRVDMSDDAQYA